ncbi:MAG TPA: hypothetical protein PK636_01330, partial [bacterium]|nr:hypothetical protein [bacterium]
RMADCVNRLIEDPGLSRRLAVSGQRLVREEYRWDRLADEFVSRSVAALARARSAPDLSR